MYPHCLASYPRLRRFDTAGRGAGEAFVPPLAFFSQHLHLSAAVMRASIVSLIYTLAALLAVTQCTANGSGAEAAQPGHSPSSPTGAGQASSLTLNPVQSNESAYEGELQPVVSLLQPKHRLLERLAMALACMSTQASRAIQNAIVA